MLRRTWILIALLTVSPAMARELVEPIRLTGRPTLNFDAPPLGTSGTVELFLSADRPQADGGPANSIETVLSNANADAIRFGVMLRADRKELGLTNGVQFVWLPAPLADGEFHHIVIATSRGLTEVSVDGTSLGVVPLAFGSTGDFTWRLGGFEDGISQFAGEIHAVRLWDRVLSADEVTRLATVSFPPMSDPAFDELVACSRFTDIEKVVYVLRRKSSTGRLAGKTTSNVVPRLIPQFGTLKRLLVEWRSQGDSNAGPAEIVDLEPTFTTASLPREMTLTEWTLQRRAAESLAYNRMLWKLLAFELERVQKGVDQIVPASSAPGWNRYLELDKVRLILPANEPVDLTEVQESRLERTLSLLSADLPELKVGQKEFLERPLFDNFRQAVDRLLTLYHNGTVRLPADTSSGARRRAVNDWDEAAEARVTLHELRRLVEWLKRARVSELELKPLGVSELESQLRARSNGTAQEARNDVIAAVSRMRSALIPPSTQDTRTDPLAVVADEERSWRIERLDSALEHFAEILQANALAEQAPGNATVIHQDAIELEEGEQIALFAGTCDPNLRTLRAVTNQSMKPVTGDVARPGSTTFLSSIPPRAKLLGHLAHVGQGRIEGFAPVYVEFESSEVAPAPWNPLHAMWPHAVSLGRFVPVDRQTPFRDDARIRELASRTPSSEASIDDQRAIRVAQQLVDQQSGTIHPHANYTSFPVCKLWFDVSGDVLLAIDDHENSKLPVELRFKVVSPGGNQFRQVVEKNSASGAPLYDLVFVSNGEFVLSRTRTDAQGKPLVSSTRYRTPDPVDDSLDPRDKLPWGATFSSNQRPILAEFNVRGYHAGLLDPRNYQLSTGCSNNVFEWPSDGSVEYQTTAVDKIIPLGLFYRSDREGSGSVRASVVNSSEEHKQAWSANAGVSAGFGGAEFSVNAKYQQESAAMSSEEHGRTVSMTHEIKHALVLNRGTMRLSADFSSRVLRLRDLYLAGELDSDWEYDNLISSFGTNYAYAVAYGGMAYQEMIYDQNEQQQMTGRGFSLQADAKGSILGFKMGASGGYSQESSESRGWGAKTESESIRTVGGDLSQGGGWSVPDHTEVPVLLDLRPIDELLSPVFFDDRLVWTKIRSRLHSRLNRGSEPPKNQNLTSRLVSVQVLQLSNYGPSDLLSCNLGVAAASYIRKKGSVDWEPIDALQSPDVKKLGADLADGIPEQIAVRLKNPPREVRELATTISRMYPTSIPQWAARRLYNYSEVTRKLRPGAGAVVGANVDTFVYDMRRDAVRDHVGWFQNDHNIRMLKSAYQRATGTTIPDGLAGVAVWELVWAAFIQKELPKLMLTGELEPLTVIDARVQQWLDPGNDLVRETVVDALLSEIRGNPARVVGGFRGTRFDPGVTLPAVDVDKPYLTRMPAAKDSDDSPEYMIQLTLTGDGSDRFISDAVKDPRMSIGQLNATPLKIWSFPESRIDIVDVVDSSGDSLQNASAKTYVYRSATGAAPNLRIVNEQSPHPILQIDWTPQDQVIAGTLLVDFYSVSGWTGPNPPPPVRLHLSFAIEQPLLLD